MRSLGVGTASQLSPSRAPAPAMHRLAAAPAQSARPPGCAQSCLPARHVRTGACVCVQGARARACVLRVRRAGRRGVCACAAVHVARVGSCFHTEVGVIRDRRWESCVLPRPTVSCLVRVLALKITRHKWGALTRSRTMSVPNGACIQADLSGAAAGPQRSGRRRAARTPPGFRATPRSPRPRRPG